MLFFLLQVLEYLVQGLRLRSELRVQLPSEQGPQLGERVTTCRGLRKKSPRGRNLDSRHNNGYH